ncbi:hypothetical protein B6U81_01110 [Thermoplasmatales archaeon ex4484_30]|nr:MAG: hypothetical protein B6U81_01110 [Thermoplasmatales archaeon ex4484_30]
MKKQHNNIWRGRQKCGNLVTTHKLLHIFLVTMLYYNTVTQFYRYEFTRLPSYQKIAYPLIQNNTNFHGDKK